MHKDLVNESKIDTRKLYFHGSSEKRVTKLDPPSFEHPFYVTTDLHYAMAFCTKSSSSTGKYVDIEKKFTPSDSNYVYVVTLKPNCKVLDYRRESSASAEYQTIYRLVGKDIALYIEHVVIPESKTDIDDFYEFMGILKMDILSPVHQYKTYYRYLKMFGIDSGIPEEELESKLKQLRKDGINVMPKHVFNEAVKLLEALGFSQKEDFDTMDVHEVMVPFLEELSKMGYQGIVAREHDYNEDNGKIVSTQYAIGIFDKRALDLMALVPMKYKWLKKVNPSYIDDFTGDESYEKIKRFVKLYRKLSGSNVAESVCWTKLLDSSFE